jgi:hypothetical protein
MTIQERLDSVELINFLKSLDIEFSSYSLAVYVYNYIHGYSDEVVIPTFEIEASFLNCYQISLEDNKLNYSDNFLQFVKNKQIELYEFNSAIVVLRILTTVNEIFKGSYVALDSIFDFLYAVNIGSVSSYFETMPKNMNDYFDIDPITFSDKVGGLIKIKDRTTDYPNLNYLLNYTGSLTASIYYKLNGNGVSKKTRRIYLNILSTTFISQFLLSYSGDFLQNLPNRLIDGVPEYLHYIYKVDSFISKNKLRHLFEYCSLREIISRFKLVDSYIEEKGLFVIKLLKDLAVNDSCSFKRSLDKRMIEFELSKTDKIVEPLAIPDKYLGVDIVELYTPISLYKESIINDNCLDRYINRINENWRIFSLRYKGKHYNAEFFYNYTSDSRTRRIWYLNQCLAYDNDEMDTVEPIIAAKISIVIKYLLVQLNKLHDTNKLIDPFRYE